MSRRLAPLLLLCMLALPRVASAGFLAGYASAASVMPGDTLGLHVSGDCATVLLRFYRHNPDTELLMDVGGLVPANVPIPDSAWVKGCNWPTLYTLRVPDYWASGMYYVEMVPSDGGPLKYISFVVKTNLPPRPIVVIQAVNTYQAYNAYGGKSLYDFNSPGGRAPKVTFNRPYDSHNGLGQPQFEVPFVRWFERSGFQADYATDVDFALDPQGTLNGHRLLLIVGHNEYWTKSMFNAAQAFADSGGNIAVLGGNTCYWQVRYENAGRTLVCYKSTDDPMWSIQTDQTTVQWRDRWVRRPECILFGVMYPYCAGTAQDSMLFTNTYPWITEGLEDQVGRKFGDKVVGYEYDTYFDDRSPAKAVKLFQTPFNDVAGCPQTQCATYYERQPAFDLFGHGGGIFNAGSIQWSWGLDPSEVGTQPDPRMQLLTSNLIKGLSQTLRVVDYGTAIVRARVDGNATPHLPLYVEPVHVGPDTTSLGKFAMKDDGFDPDEIANDGVYAAQFELYPDERLPLKLKWSSTNGHDVKPVRAGNDWFWVSDTHFDAENEVYTRNLDTLVVDGDLVDVPPAPPNVEFRLVPVPNPFGGRLTLTWGAGNVVRQVDIHDTRGRLVATIPVDRNAAAAAWNGRDDRGHPAPPGVYWARAIGEHGTRVARLVKF